MQTNFAPTVAYPRILPTQRRDFGGPYWLQENNHASDSSFLLTWEAPPLRSLTLVAFESWRRRRTLLSREKQQEDLGRERLAKEAPKEFLVLRTEVECLRRSLREDL